MSWCPYDVNFQFMCNISLLTVGILAKFLGIEIAAVDVQTNNVYTYSPDPASDARIYLLYDGERRIRL